MEKIAILGKHKTIGVFLSGGIDSAVLLYVTAKLCPNSNFIAITGSHKHLTYYNESYSKKVIDYLTSIYEDRILAHHIFRYEDRKDAQNKKTNNNIIMKEKYNIDAFISGKTLNPKALITEGRDTSRDSPVDYITEICGIPHYQPLHMLDKKDIHNICIEYDILDLIDFTISCESETPPRPCKKCWWCQEKYYGFNLY
jgi:7-cyano-7-deazaguanine synthase in queuosine biosynthesis